MSDNQVQMKEIETLLEQYKTGMTAEQSAELLKKMKDVRFIVPVTFPQDDTLEAMKEELARTGKPVRLPKDARPIPVLIQNPNKEHFLAVYTSLAQLPQDKRHNGVIEMQFEACMNYAKNSKSPVYGVVVNPFSNNFVVRPRKEQEVTPAQFHMLARKNVEYVLFPHTIYTKGKEYFDTVDEEVLYQYFKDQYRDKIELPYTTDDFEVMQLGVHPQLDMIHISMPTKKVVEGGCLRIYVTWHKEKECAGYYMVMRGKEADDRQFMYMNNEGKMSDLGAAPVESAEMQRVIELELERYAGN
ncbi:MAG: SseB family protein [Eubacterium sp.]|nr:SseB family protein [Eubacterium sp.]